jgi:RNA polymerase sigma-70 factor, ECF subfamily
VTSVLAMDCLTTSHDETRRAQPTRRVAAVSDDEDAQLMLAYAGGEMRAFETLYSRHRAALYRYLMRQARDGEIAADLFQEVWSRVVANRARYEPRAKFRTFLFTLAHNCFIDHCRRARVRPAGLGIEDADAADLLPADESARPDHALVRDEDTVRYRAALAALPSEQRDVYLLHEESDLSLEEIARVTGVGAETAKSRLRYAVNKLKAALSAAEEPA